MADSRKTQKAGGNGKPAGGAKARKSGRLWVVVSLLVVAGTVFVLLGAMRTPENSNLSKIRATFTARKDELIVTVTETGSIKAQQSTDIECDVGGRGMEIADIVPEGTVITQEDVDNGRILCQLNSSDLEDYYSREKTELSADQASYLQAQESHLIQLKQNESDIAAAQLAVEFGLLDLQNYLGKTAAEKLVNQVEQDPNATIEMSVLMEFLADPNSLGGEALQSLKQYKDNILLAEGQFQKFTDVLAGTVKLHDANYASDLDLQSAKLDVDRFRVQKESAEEALNLFNLYGLPKQAKQLLSDYAESKRDLVRTYARTRSQLAQAEVRLESTKARYELQTERVDKLEREIAACTIRAPSPGIVIYGSSADWEKRRQDPIEVGDMVHRGQKIFSIPNSNLMGVELRVHEASVNMVKPGQRAKVTVEAHPDTPFEGKVTSVAPLPDPQRGWLDPGSKVYTTQVTIDGAHEIIKPGMSAKVEILVDHLYDVVIVPVQVVANRGGRKVCYIDTGGMPEEREVETGAFNDIFVEIVNGVEVGENVLLSPPRNLEPKTDPRTNTTVASIAGR
ncbi:MAG TPA: HlyD family efflux transporter periplasmic adaptor subunit [Phycisphaerales bacterium]|nr:HlyD family efflux transporter periplasmic adaptor subunit [Phycisphaerales bacterium]